MRSALRPALVVLLLVGAPVLGFASGQPLDELPPASPKPSIPWSHQSPPSAAQEAASTLQDQIDVLQYVLDLEFEPATRSVSGSVIVSAGALTPGFRTLVLDLKDNMMVSSVKRGSTSLTFSHSGDLLYITMDRDFNAGETFEVVVTYGGVPISIGLGSIGWNKFVGGPLGGMVWTLSEPNCARSWWPSKDRPDDKALIQASWTVPEAWTATGNGILLSSRRLSGGRKVFKWRATHPLPPYLVMIAATNYVKLTDTYRTPSGYSMPVDHYVYPEHVDNALESFSNTVPMIDFFSRKFGEYPFLEDKYGMSSVPWGGAMEHATNTSYGYLLIDGGHVNDSRIAHELAHQWWGDAVTPASWSDVWLNEGFATYSEALWAENSWGVSGYRNFMNALWREQFDGPLTPPVSLFSTTVYNKGAWVLHMLRHVMSDPVFFSGLGDWYIDHRDASGSSEMLRQTMEARYGAMLDWFFQQWVYDSGSPSYEYGWTLANRGPGAYRVYVRIHQTQTVKGPFTMPIDVSLTTPSGPVVRSVWNDRADQVFILDLAEPVTAVSFDPGNWVLKASLSQITLLDTDGDGVPDSSDNCAHLVNADQADLDGDEQGNACDADDDADGIADVSDCAPLDAAQGRPPALFPVAMQKITPSMSTLSWAPGVPSADRYDVVRGSLAGLHGGSYGSCQVSGLSTWSSTDGSRPAPGTGYCYLVRAVDLGCGGPGPAGMDSHGLPIPSPCP